MAKTQKKPPVRRSALMPFRVKSGHIPRPERKPAVPEITLQSFLAKRNKDEASSS
jgi:hypothetical protein